MLSAADGEIPDYVPVLILANKTDRPNAANEEEIKNVFQLHNKTTGKVQYIIHTKIHIV